MMHRIVVIAGPERSGKYPLARELMKSDSNLALVHRDHLRDHIGTKVEEAKITALMGDLARGLLREGLSPIVCAWNLEPQDEQLWNCIAIEFGVPLVWLDVREPAVAKMIPPLEGWTPATFDQWSDAR